MRNIAQTLRSCAAILCLGTAAAASVHAQVQPWPTKPIRLVVPAPPPVALPMVWPAWLPTICKPIWASP